MVKTSFAASSTNPPQYPGKKLKRATSKTDAKWLVVLLVLAIAFGILAGAIAAGRLRFLFVK